MLRFSAPSQCIQTKIQMHFFSMHYVAVSCLVTDSEVVILMHVCIFWMYLSPPLKPDVRGLTVMATTTHDCKQSECMLQEHVLCRKYRMDTSRFCHKGLPNKHKIILGTHLVDSVNCGHILIWAKIYTLCWLAERDAILGTWAQGWRGREVDCAPFLANMSKDINQNIF